MIKKPVRRQGGFTIIELMIATVVLSTLLLIVSSIMINISNLYYKGVIQSRVQNSVRDVADDMSQRFELSSQLPTAHHHALADNPPVEAYCFGNIRYTFVTGWQQGGLDLASKQVPHVLWRDNSVDMSCTPADLTADNPSGAGKTGTDLLGQGMRLTTLNLASTSDLSAITLTLSLAYGDNDLLCNTHVANDCARDGHDSTHLTDINANVVCRGGVNSRFCAVAGLRTTFTKRL